VGIPHQGILLGESPAEEFKVRLAKTWGILRDKGHQARLTPGTQSMHSSLISEKYGVGGKR
jgi:hypothetical protein